MIIYKTGNLLEAEVQAIVNTVNTVGVMGKGVALQVKNTFPENYSAYKKAVKNGQVKLGQTLVVPVKTINGVEYIINFPTKAHWRNPSNLSWIKTGLIDLREKLTAYNIKSVALPPLGCGNGGLNWEEVRPEIDKVLSDLPVEIIVYMPSYSVQEILKKEERSKAARLTPARAMLLQLFYRYRALGEAVSEFAAEKLSYFLQRFGEKQLKLSFQKGYYGPYSGKVRHLLYQVNGYYLKGYEQKDTKPFEELELLVDRAHEVDAYIDKNLSTEQRARLNKVSTFIEGFESPYGLELLATVDFLLQENTSYTIEELKQQLWSQRKYDMFSEQHLQLALDHISDHALLTHENK